MHFQICRPLFSLGLCYQIVYISQHHENCIMPWQCDSGKVLPCFFSLVLYPFSGHLLIFPRIFHPLLHLSTRIKWQILINSRTKRFLYSKIEYRKLFHQGEFSVPALDYHELTFCWFHSIPLYTYIELDLVPDSRFKLRRNQK